MDGLSYRTGQRRLNAVWNSCFISDGRLCIIRPMDFTRYDHIAVACIDDCCIQAIFALFLLLALTRPAVHS